jgi:TIR domain-containing protein
MGYTFISYSRKQLYFAESIVLKLQQAGFEIWFDLQKLEPGVHWANALAEGYGNCERLVFIASKAALQSPYVQVEWETALRNGREVIVVLTEPVTLPESLKNCAVYDASARFDPTLQDLIRYLRGESTARHDPVPAAGRSVFLNKMPLDIWLTVSVMLMPAITVWIATFGFSLTSV